MTVEGSAKSRVGALIAAARRIANAADPLGIEARATLPESTGLSPEGIELGLARCLETHPTDDEVLALVRSVPRVPRAHVLSSANVFVAVHRALALALAASDDVVIRPSRREPVMARLFERAAPGLFRIVDRLEPSPGDHLWAYGEAETLDSLRRTIPGGVTLHGHGPGIGVVFVESPEMDRSRLAETAEAVAEDMILFDQRGCLSPRVVCVLDEPAAVRAFAEALARALSREAVRVPLGRLDPDELGGRRRYRDTLLAAGAVLPSGDGVVGLDTDGRAVVVPPVGRNAHVMRCADLDVVSRTLGGTVTCAGVAGGPELVRRVASLFPHARIARPGAMQTPPFDGPVDRRPQ